MPMGYEQITGEVFDILSKDWAGCLQGQEARGGTWRTVLDMARLCGCMDDSVFLALMRLCLACLGDGDLLFVPGPASGLAAPSRPLDVHRHDDALWVTRADAAGALVVGDAVTKLDGKGLDEYLAPCPGNPLGSEDPHRQRWGAVLACAACATVRHADGLEETVDMRGTSRAEPDDGHCAFSVLDDGTCLIEIAQLDNLEAAALIVENGEAVRDAARIVFDVRRCSGGTESMAYPLLNLLFDSAVDLRDLVGPQTLVTNYSRGNCERRSDQIARLRSLTATERQGEARDLDWLDENLAAVARYSGAGWVEETVLADSLRIAAAPRGQRVAVLTDTETSDAAEWFASIAKRAPRATIVGRATRGSLGYSNPVTVSFDDRFLFTYPMSRTVGPQGAVLGPVDPDVTVAFTSQECLRDVVLERALAL